MALAQSDLTTHIVARELIALRNEAGSRPVIGMFLGGDGLADTILPPRHVYQLCLPNGATMRRPRVALLARSVPAAPVTVSSAQA